MMAPNTERPLDGGEGHAGKTARGPRHGDPTDVRCRGRRRGRRGRNTRVSKSAKGLMVVPFGRGGDWTAGNLLKIGHQHQTRILLATNMGNAPGVRLAQPLKKYGGIASALIACLLVSVITFSGLRNASLTYLKQFPPAAPPYRALPVFGLHGGHGAWGGRLDVINAVGRTGWSKNGAAREPRPCGALLSGQGSAARPCPLELCPGVVLCSCSRTMPGGGVAWGPWNPWNP